MLFFPWIQVLQCPESASNDNHLVLTAAVSGALLGSGSVKMVWLVTTFAGKFDGRTKSVGCKLSQH
jgi:hypothetical protein